MFISHDTRDADVAEAFGNLLTDASGGVLRSFRSSDRRGTTGIEFGAEWYRAIMERLGDANDVVALLTPYSIDRPWILYEAGVAKGKLDTVVFGVAIGIPLDKASIGPFAQFQNSSDDEESLTKLVLQLIRRNPNADPREEAVLRQVKAFRETADAILKQRKKPEAETPGEEIDSSAVAKLFEEVKIMFRQLPQQVESALEVSRRGSSGKRSRRLDPEFIDHLLFTARAGHPRDGIAAWLIAASTLRDELPWLYDLLLEIYRSGMQGQRRNAERIARALVDQLHSSNFRYMLHQSVGRDGDRTADTLMRMLPDYLKQFVSTIEPVRKVTRISGAIKKDKTGGD